MILFALCVSYHQRTEILFTDRLQRATDEEIRKAINDMRHSNGKHKSRILACERELRKRNKK